MASFKPDGWPTVVPRILAHEPERLVEFLRRVFDAKGELHANAPASSARSLEAPADMPYGDRRCMVEDAWGNTWQIATRRTRG